MKNNILLVLILLILISCGQGESEITKESIYKGTTGVNLDVLQGGLPKEIFEDQEFNIVLKLTNKGVYPVINGQILINLEQDYMSEVSDDNVITGNYNLEGKENFQKIDDWEVMDYTVKTKKIDALSETHSTIVMITTCYDYNTKLFTDACIDTDPNNLKPREKVCAANTISFSGGQGGPLAFTRIEPAMLLKEDTIKPQFKIYVQNQGQGSVIAKGASSKICSSQGVNRFDYNAISLKRLEFSDYSIGDFDCKPDELRLKDEEEYFICTLKTGIDQNIDSYKTPLYVELDYGYTFTESHEVLIEKVLTH